MLAKHSATNGAETCSAFSGVRWKAENLSTSRPEQLPIATTFSANSTAGIAITHSFVVRSAAKLWSRLLTMQAIKGGSKSTIICQDIVMTLARPLCAVVNRTTAPVRVADRPSIRESSSSPRLLLRSEPRRLSPSLVGRVRARPTTRVARLGLEGLERQETANQQKDDPEDGQHADTAGSGPRNDFRNCMGKIIRTRPTISESHPKMVISTGQPLVHRLWK